MTIRAVAALVVALSGCSGEGSNGEVAQPLTTDAAVDAPVDAPVDALACPVTPDEMDLDPLGALTIGVATNLSGLMICPASDKDYFKVVVPTTGSNLEVLIESTPTEATVFGSILNKELTPISNAAPVSGMPLVRRAYVPNLLSGTYYVQTFAPPSGIGHYKLTVTVTPP